MANPQTSNGYTKIANEIVEALCKVRLPAEVMCVSLTVIRLTYGWSRTKATITRREFMDATGMNKGNVNRAIKKAIALGCVRTDSSNKNHRTDSVTYSFQKNYKLWTPPTVPDDSSATSVRSDSNTSVHTDSKTTVSADSSLISKEKKETNKQQVCFDHIWELYPNKLGRKDALRHFKASVKNEQNWLDIQTALKNYEKSSEVERGFIKHGSTWFNNWQDWVKYKDPTIEDTKGHAL